MSKLVDVMILNVLWIVCSLPVITFGASTIALYYALMKDAKDEGTHYVQLFFRSFKQNFRQGVIVGLIYLLSVAGLAYAFYFYTLNLQSFGTMGSVMRIVCLALLVIVMMVFTYVFPLLAQFENTIWKTIKNALLFSVAKLGWTVLQLLIVGVFIFILWKFIFWPLLFFGFGLIVFLDAFILNHIFKPFVDEQMPEEPEYTETDYDEEPDNHVYLTASQMQYQKPETVSPEEKSENPETVSPEGKSEKPETVSPEEKCGDPEISLTDGKGESRKEDG